MREASLLNPESPPSFCPSSPNFFPQSPVPNLPTHSLYPPTPTHVEAQKPNEPNLTTSLDENANPSRTPAVINYSLVKQILNKQKSEGMYNDPLKCPMEGCEQVQFKGGYRTESLPRHMRIRHGGNNGSWVEIPCKENGCGKIFRRTDARLKHYRKYHPHLAIRRE